MDLQDEITEILKSKEFGERDKKIRAARRLRLHRLVLKYGFDNVTAASGLTMSSLMFYIKSKYPPVSEKVVMRAEYVFAEINNNADKRGKKAPGVPG